MKTSVSITSPTLFFFSSGFFFPMSFTCVCCHASGYIILSRVVRSDTQNVLSGGSGMPESSSSCFTVAAGWQWRQLGECSLSPPAWPNALWQAMGSPHVSPCPDQAPGVGGGSSSCWHPWSRRPSCVLSAPSELGDFEYFGDATCPDEHRGFLLQKHGRFHLLASFWHPSPMQRYRTMSFDPLEIKGLRRAVRARCVWRVAESLALPESSAWEDLLLEDPKFSPCLCFAVFSFHL